MRLSFVVISIALSEPFAFISGCGDDAKLVLKVIPLTNNSNRTQIVSLLENRLFLILLPSIILDYGYNATSKSKL
jgi:hypothetical protein